MKMNSENDANSSLLMGFLLGSVVGAGIALLLAPDSGAMPGMRVK